MSSTSIDAGVLEPVRDGIREIEARFPDATVEFEPDKQGGAYVRIDPVALGSVYQPGSSWLGFQLPFTYPRADVYPLFVTGSLRRRDGRPLGSGIQITTWRGKPAAQLSRRSNQRNAATDSAALKALRVLDWLRTHPGG